MDKTFTDDETEEMQERKPSLYFLGSSLFVDEGKKKMMFGVFDNKKELQKVTAQMRENGDDHFMVRKLQMNRTYVIGYGND